jgi:hypothetical protein
MALNLLNGKVRSRPCAVILVARATGPLNHHQISRFVSSSRGNRFGGIASGCGQHGGITHVFCFPECLDFIEGVGEFGGVRRRGRIVGRHTNGGDGRRNGLHPHLIGGIVLSA